MFAHVPRANARNRRFGHVLFLVIPFVGGIDVLWYWCETVLSAPLPLSRCDFEELFSKISVEKDAKLTKDDFVYHVPCQIFDMAPVLGGGRGNRSDEHEHE